MPNNSQFRIKNIKITKKIQILREHINIYEKTTTVKLIIINNE